MPRPYDLGEDLDAVILGGVRSPGLVVLAGHDRAKNWDIKAAKGSTGASTTLNGDAPAKFTATFTLANDEAIEGASGPSDFAQWDEFQKLIESTTNGPKPFALRIYHPDLARNRITEVTNGGVSGLKHDGKGGSSVVVTFLEYKPAKKKASGNPTAKAGRTGTTTLEKPDPNAAAKAELAGLLTEAKKP